MLGAQPQTRWLNRWGYDWTAKYRAAPAIDWERRGDDQSGEHRDVTGRDEIEMRHKY